MTISTEVPLVDDVVISASSEVKCSFYGCTKTESAFNFGSDFFAYSQDVSSENDWTKILEITNESLIFATELEANNFIGGSDNFRITNQIASGFLVRWWGRRIDFYCPTHSTHCESCSEFLSMNNSTIIGDDYYCDDCRDNNFSYCDNCSDWCTEVSEVEGDYMCNYCVNSIGAQFCEHCDMYERHLCDLNYEPEDVDIWNSRNYEGVMNYNFKPARPDFFMGSTDVDDSRLFYGMELEVESMENSFSDGMEIVKESLAELVYFKADGSLDRGYELVTYPFSFNYYSEAIDFSFLSRLQELGYRSWSAGTCGLHVHISRTGFSSSGHVWKFAQLILSNQNAWSKLAGRHSSRWASFDAETNSVMKVLKGEKFPERYCAVNLSNTDTIEVRIFRGSLNERRVRSAIESVDCAIQYTRSLSVHDINQGALKFGRFADWVNENRTDCASFIDLMCEYGLIPSLALVAEPELDLLDSAREVANGSLSVLSANVDGSGDRAENIIQSSNRTNLENGDN
jgi:hypothetical protein